MTEQQLEYYTEQMIEGIHNAFRRDLDLSLEEEEQLEWEIRARIKFLFDK